MCFIWDFLCKCWIKLLTMNCRLLVPANMIYFICSMEIQTEKCTCSDGFALISIVVIRGAPQTQNLTKYVALVSLNTSKHLIKDNTVFTSHHILLLRFYLWMVRGFVWLQTIQLGLTAGHFKSKHIYLHIFFKTILSINVVF